MSRPAPVVAEEPSAAAAFLLGGLGRSHEFLGLRNQARN